MLEPQAPLSRRQFLKKASVLLGAAAFSSLSLGESCKSSPKQSSAPTTSGPSPSPTMKITQPPATNGIEYLASSDPSTIDNSNFAITPMELTHVQGSTTIVDVNSYRLKVSGLVDNPLTLTYDQIKQYPMVTNTILLICPETFADNPAWTGIPMAKLLADAQLQVGAQFVYFNCADGRDDGMLNLADAQAEGVILAVMEDGAPLSPLHGFPIRLVRRGSFGELWHKFITEISIA